MNESKLISVGPAGNGGANSFNDQGIISALNELKHEFRTKELSMSPSFHVPSAPLPNVVVSPQEVTFSPVITPAPVQIYQGKTKKLETLLLANLILLGLIATINSSIIIYILIR